MEEILEAKRKLYVLLLKKDVNKITKNEIDLMYILSKDKQIQKQLQRENAK